MVKESRNKNQTLFNFNSERSFLSELVQGSSNYFVSTCAYESKTKTRHLFSLKFKRGYFIFLLVLILLNMLAPPKPHLFLSLTHTFYEFSIISQQHHFWSEVQWSLLTKRKIKYITFLSRKKYTFLSQFNYELVANALGSITNWFVLRTKYYLYLQFKMSYKKPVPFWFHHACSQL